MTIIAKSYSDDEYYTTEESAEKFFQQIVIPSGILKHETILMPFSSKESPVHKVARKYHNSIIPFNGDLDFWKTAKEYDDVAVVDNPPFSISKKIEKLYFDDGIPFVLFRSAISYPKFIFKKRGAGIIYENSGKGVVFDWGIAKHIRNDEYIKRTYPNLLDNLKAANVMQKKVPIRFSFYKTDYNFKVKTVSFDELRYPKKKDQCWYVNRGVYDEDTQVWIDETDNRVHLLSY